MNKGSKATTFVYVADTNDSIACQILDMLDGAQLPTHRLVPGSALSDSSVVALFTSPGVFPSRYVRLVQPNDTERRGIIIPAFAEPLTRQIALNGSTCHENMRRMPYLREALLNMHAQLHGLPAPSIQRAPKARGQKLPRGERYLPL